MSNTSLSAGGGSSKSKEARRRSSSKSIADDGSFLAESNGGNNEQHDEESLATTSSMNTAENEEEPCGDKSDTKKSLEAPNEMSTSNKVSSVSNSEGGKDGAVQSSSTEEETAIELETEKSDDTDTGKRASKEMASSEDSRAILDQVDEDCDITSKTVDTRRSLNSSNLVSSSIVDISGGDEQVIGSMPNAAEASSLDSETKHDTEIEDRAWNETAFSKVPTIQNQNEEDSDIPSKPAGVSSATSPTQKTEATSSSLAKNEEDGQQKQAGDNCRDDGRGDDVSSSPLHQGRSATSLALPATEASTNETNDASQRRSYQRHAARSRRRNPQQYQYDSRVAEKRRQIMEQAMSTASHGGEVSHSSDQTALDANVGVAAATMQRGTQQEVTAPGDYLSATMVECSALGDELAAAMVEGRNRAQLVQEIHKTDEFTNTENTLELSNREDGDEKRVSRQTPANDESSDQARPGAYQVSGRAVGSFPAWGRQSTPQGEYESDQIMIEIDDSQDVSELDYPQTPTDSVLATALDEKELEERVRQDMMRNAVQAEMVEPTSHEFKTKKRYIVACLVVALVLIILTIGIPVGMSVGLSNNDSSDSEDGHARTEVPTVSPTGVQRPTLETVKERGFLICGVADFVGFATVNSETGLEEGFDVDVCRAVAAAIFGDGSFNRIRTVIVDGATRFLALADGTIDVLFRWTTHTMERDVYHGGASTGFSFSVPYLYDGVQFAGRPPFGQCANNLSSYFGDCRLLMVCVENETSHVPVVEDLLPASRIHVTNDIYQDFIHGPCNAIAGEKFFLTEQHLSNLGYNGSYEIGENFFSKEPLAIVTRDGDTKWSDFVNWILQALLVAEERGISNNSASSFSHTSVFGDEYEHMFVNAISAVGNYRDIYERNLEPIVPRQTVDKINADGRKGLLYSFPFGEPQSFGPGPAEEGTLKKLAEREELVCGVTERPGFAVFNSSTQRWHGLDVDYCRALSSSIFNGLEERIVFKNITGRAAGFEALATEFVDVLAGVNVDIFSDVKEPQSKQGFSFSQPYFYNPPSGVVDNLLLNQTRALATRQRDSQWSAFVYWVVSSTFYAEENYIYQSDSMMMPRVQLFGPTYEDMFRNAIAAVGNSKEMYERNVESLIPRSGRNMPNRIEFGPQHYTLAGI